jgi:hypothetical protein
MPTQTSGPISLADVQSNLGGSNPISLSEYYSADAGLPASGTISMSEMYGRPRPTVPVVSGVAFSPPSGASSYSATVSLSDSGANGTLYYIQKDTSTIPAATDSGWQTSNVFSQPADTVRYYRAMRYNPPYWAISGYWLRTAPSAGWTLTQGVSGSFYGYGTGVGSISPSTLNGANLITVGLSVITIKGSTSYLFIVAVSGNRAQNFFASINESSLGTKTTASANSFAYDSNSGNTTWTWQLTSAPANWDGSGDLTVVFV